MDQCKPDCDLARVRGRCGLPGPPAGRAHAPEQLGPDRARGDSMAYDAADREEREHGQP